MLGASEFAALKVTDAGVEGLDKAVEAFKTAHPSLFSTSRPMGSADGGARGTGTAPMDMNALLRRGAGRA
ncbi:MAG: hypothetical protein LC798_08365 [Chloroflexi bacterium]|nr:hypothetical protein [Chloroflexota bacterium]